MSEDIHRLPVASDPTVPLDGQPTPDMPSVVLVGSEEAQEDFGQVIPVQLPSFEVEAIEAAEADARPRGWARIREAVTRPFHRSRHRELGRPIVPAFDSLDEDEQEAVAVTAELGNEALEVTVEAFDQASAPAESVENYRPGEFVRRAPKFIDQVEDASRTTPITYADHLQRSMTGAHFEPESQRTVTEHEGLVGLRDFLHSVIAQEDVIPSLKYQHLGDKARSMLENLTYIGKPEYDEAVASIADGWRKQLQADPDLQICVLSTSLPDTTKSGAFLLDNVLKHFSDEELDAFQGRLVTRPENLTAEPDKTNVVLMDDWVSSGMQMDQLISNTIHEYPQLKERLSVQLIAATDERIEHGVPWYEARDKEPEYFPVRAYFAAHTAGSGHDSWDSSTHITGYYCAVDYGFNDDLARMAAAMHQDMPPLTNIRRPYRDGGFVPEQYLRLREPVVATTESDHRHETALVAAGAQDEEDWYI